MARRGVPKAGVHHFIREWMDALSITQAEMIRRTDWSKATANQVYNGKQDYSPSILNAAGLALNAAPFELLMPYERAMALRRLRETAVQIVSDTPAENVTPIAGKKVA